MRAAYCTLGCKVNQYDTEAMRECMERAGYETVGLEECADVYIINTCTVTNIADRKSRQMIRRAIERNPQAAVIVTGCLAQRDASAVLQMEGVRAVVGVNHRASIVEVARRVCSGEVVCNVQDVAGERVYEALSHKKSAERTRAHIKISDGCDNFCSYCIIPYTRGRVRSRAFADVVEEVQALSGEVKEVVLTGIHISSYGRDIGTSLIELIERIAQIEGIVRIRLGSIEPTILTDAFCARAARVEKLCPHFHISLQSGCTAVLQRMNRTYTAPQYAQFCARLRSHFEDPAITTDVIAGFPEETQEEHEQTLAFIREIGFSRIHVFPYSKREGTVAAMRRQLPMAVRKQRAQEIAAVAKQMQCAYLTQFVGKTVRVLFEEEKDGWFYGYTDRYLRVKGRASANEIKDVRIIGMDGDVLLV